MEEKCSSDQLTHIPVLLREVIRFLKVNPEGIYLDGTVGLGGHASAILSILSEKGTLVGVDLDDEALARCKDTIGAASNCHLVQGSFSDIPDFLQRLKIQQIDGLLLDLGLSSLQLDSPQRGFSYRFDGPLDMRYSTIPQITAHDIVNTWSESELRSLIKKYGEERSAGLIARTIIQERANSTIDTTMELRTIVSSVIPGRFLNKSLSRIFQAIRITVNGELEALTQVVSNFTDYLKPLGRAVIISYHSLEDRIVKHAFRNHARDCICPPELPVCHCDHRATVRLLTHQPVTPTQDELADNPRSKSAKLRAVEKL
ncbi:MAG: 16S rRNA (cytosine(1402)-N(4))-methyltransferase RsmH [Fidelibacterota bacterium]